MKKILLFLTLFSLCSFANAQRKVEIVEPVKQDVADTGGRVIKRKVAIGRFSNETQYAKGIFYDKENDPMGKHFVSQIGCVWKVLAVGKERHRIAVGRSDEER